MVTETVTGQPLNTTEKWKLVTLKYKVLFTSNIYSREVQDSSLIRIFTNQIKTSMLSTSIPRNCHWWPSLPFQDTSKHSFKCILWRQKVSKTHKPLTVLPVHLSPHAESQLQRVQRLPYRTRSPDLAPNMPKYKRMTEQPDWITRLQQVHFHSLISSVWSDALSHSWVGFVFIYLSWKLFKLYLCNI